MSSKIAEFVGDWWVNQLKNPTVSSFDNGDGNPLGSALAAIVANQQEVKEIDYLYFRKRLMEMIDENNITHFCVDYNPDINLSKAIEGLTIKPNRFPWKTVMNIDIESNQVTVRKGYSSQPVIYNIN